MDYQALESTKEKVNKLLKATPVEQIEKINISFDQVYAYDALSFSGKNKIPYESVVKLLKTGDILQYNEREKKEILNHYVAFNFVKDMIKQKTPLTEEKLKDIHEHLLDGVSPGGTYRNVNIVIPGASHQPPDHIKVYERMRKLFVMLNEMPDSIEKAVYAHAMVAKIHPFLDGNGRLSRLVLNYYLIKNYYLPISIPFTRRDEYLKHLEYFKTLKDIKPLEEFIANLLLDRYNNILINIE